MLDAWLRERSSPSMVCAQCRLVAELKSMSITGGKGDAKKKIPMKNKNSVCRHSTLSGCLTSGILSARHSTSSGCLTSGILSADIPPSLDASHPESCQPEIPPLPNASHPEFCPSKFHLLWMPRIRNSVRRRSTFSGCLASGILSVDIPPSPDVSHPTPDARWERGAI
ncbi:hypothetical protein VitviT2T_007066 [Vitis vinifera]|uniref:Uncharacterized protein n=1 Tax=Vitis vinifera TaxID=29760 RepID=A0ABY9BXQ3_VITVI|nr:hypothetical protein VitviT2T_007066 [Vitis vinifera]